MNPFSEKYKTLKNSELLAILDSPSDYQIPAVEAAQLELNNRKLNTRQLSEAQNENELRVQRKTDKEQKIKLVEDGIKSVGSSLIENFKPGNRKPGINKSLNSIIIFLTCLFIFKFYNDFRFLKYMLTGYNTRWDISSIIYLLPLILLPTCIILFRLRKKAGWILTASYLCYNAATAATEFFIELNRKPFSMPSLEKLFPHVSLITFCVMFALFGGALLFICKKGIRRVYHVNEQSMYTTIGIVAALTVFLVLNPSVFY